MISEIENCTKLLQKFLNQKKYKFKNIQSNLLPTTHGVYRIFETESCGNSSMYIGISNNIRRRIYRNHFAGQARCSTFRRKLLSKEIFQTEEEISSYLENMCSFQFVELNTKNETIKLEHFSIAILSPIHND